MSSSSREDKPWIARMDGSQALIWDKTTDEQGRIRWKLAYVDVPQQPATATAIPATLIPHEKAATTAAEKWAEVEARLAKARAQKQEYLRAQEEAFGELDQFLKTYGEEGKALAGNYPQLVAGERELQELVDAEKKRRAEARRAKAAVAQAEEELRQQRERHGKETTELLEQMRRAKIEAVRAEGSKMPRCFVCKLEGVMRGRECPRREFHGKH